MGPSIRILGAWQAPQHSVVEPFWALVGEKSSRKRGLEAAEKGQSKRMALVSGYLGVLGSGKGRSWKWDTSHFRALHVGLRESSDARTKLRIYGDRLQSCLSRCDILAEYLLVSKWRFRKARSETTILPTKQLEFARNSQLFNDWLVAWSMWCWSLWRFFND